MLGSWQPTWAIGLLAAALASSMGGPAPAADLRIEVAGLRNSDGTLYVAVCTEAEFLEPGCAHTGSAPAGDSAVVVSDVPPGTYAVQAVHDENNNGTLDRPGFLPTEGLGFSRDAPMRLGPPRFRDAAFELTEAGATVSLTMRYFQ